MTAEEKKNAAILEHIKLEYRRSDLATGRTRTLTVTSDEIRDLLDRVKP